MLEGFCAGEQVVVGSRILLRGDVTGQHTYATG